MQELLNEIASLYEEFKNNAEINLSKGTKAAGLRARKSALAIMGKMKEYRKASMEAEKA